MSSGWLARRLDDPLALAVGFFAVACVLAALVLSTGRQAVALQESGVPASRIISLMPALTETVAAVGAGAALVGVSDYCSRPAELCARLPRVGGQQANLELIMQLHPDLVLLGEGLADLELKLQSLGIGSQRFDTRGFASIEASFQAIGRRTGHAAEGDALAARLRQELVELAAAGQRRGSCPRVLLVIGHAPDELADIWAAGSDTFLGEILQTAGAANVIERSGYAAIGREAILSLDPEIVIDLYAPGTTAPPTSEQALALWGQLTALSAVRSGQVFYRTNNAYVAPGPRVVTEHVLEDFAAMLAGQAPREAAPR